jgi:hypothetical protein
VSLCGAEQAADGAGGEEQGEEGPHRDLHVGDGNGPRRRLGRRGGTLRPGCRRSFGTGTSTAACSTVRGVAGRSWGGCGACEGRAIGCRASGDGRAVRPFEPAGMARRMRCGGVSSPAHLVYVRQR